jgi:hypothetical protein
MTFPQPGANKVELAPPVWYHSSKAGLGMLRIRPVRQTFVRSRLISACLILLCIGSATSCGRKNLGLDQDVTNSIKPEDILFIDFQKNWKQFINSSREFTLPVVPVREPERQTWQPILQQDCVFSADAGESLPQIILTWNETAAPSTLRVAEKRNPAALQRFDLSLHYQGFERNFFTTALSSAKLQRFQLPSNSALITNTGALMLAGTGLFPKLVDYHTVMVTPPGSNVAIPRQTLVVRDLAPGLAYTLRKANLDNEQWSGGDQFTFSTPVCPKSF